MTLDNNQLNPHKWQPTLLGEFLYIYIYFILRKKGEFLYDYKQKSILIILMALIIIDIMLISGRPCLYYQHLDTYKGKGKEREGEELRYKTGKT